MNMRNNIRLKTIAAISPGDKPFSALSSPTSKK